MKKVLLLLAAMSLIISFNHQEVRAQEEVLWEGFEDEIKWSPVDWENVGGIMLAQSQEKVTEGSSSLKVTMQKEGTDWKNKVVFSRVDYLNLEDTDIIMDVYSPYISGISVALAFDTGDDWVYYETPSVPLSDGWNKDVTFNLDGSNFKCRQSNWQHTKAMTDKDNVRKVHIMIYRPSRMQPQTVYIDNIRLK